MNRSRFILSPEALIDLDEIWLFIAKERSIEAAELNEEKLRSAMKLLAKRPNIGHKRPDLTDQSVKFWPVGSYLVVYDPSRKPMWIVRVLHASRDIAALL